MSHKWHILSLVFLSLLTLLFWWFCIAAEGGRRTAVNENTQFKADLAIVQNQISQLKADRLELYKALSSCNFLRKMEKFPLNQVEMDLFKAVTTYYSSEAEVTKAIEKYKAK